MKLRILPAVLALAGFGVVAHWRSSFPARSSRMASVLLFSLVARVRASLPDTTPLAHEPPVVRHLLDHAPEIRVVQRQPRGAAMPWRRPPFRGVPDARHQGVHAEIDRERLLAMEAPQRGKDQALGDTSLRGIDRPDRPRLAHPGCVPSTAIRIARWSLRPQSCRPSTCRAF